MPAIVFDDWGGGLDLRRSVSMAAANVLARLSNCYITNGKAIKKRPCLDLVVTLEPGTVGLRAAGGKLNTFYGPGPGVNHGNSLFRANRVPHPTSNLHTPVAAHYGQLFNRLLYCSIEYSNGEVFHHYLDQNTSGSPTWLAATPYALNAFVAPSVANGFRYKATIGGTSGAVQPTWPTAIGATVADGTVTWTCTSFVVTDTNCPHSKQVVKLGQKLYSPKEGNVPFCATALPRDWTTPNDAGFIPAEIEAAGSDTVTAIGDFRGDLGIFFADSAQLWAVDPDPTLNSLKDVAPNVGTLHRDAVAPFANDLTFLASPGFRSLSLAVITDNLEESDVGSPIDELRPEIADADNPISIYYPTLSQLWTINRTRAYALTYSKKAKITAWSVFDFPVTIDAAATLNKELYLRSGDNVYRVSKTRFNDNGSLPLCEVEMFFQDGKTPGILKQWVGFDAVTKGQPEIAFKFDPRNAALATPFLSLANGAETLQTYLSLPGVLGNNASTPASSAVAVTDDLDLRVLAAADDWTPTSVQVLLAKKTGFDAYVFGIMPGSGNLELVWNEADATERTVESSAAPVIANGAALWVRVTLDLDNGAGGHAVKFFTSPATDGINWTQLGTTQNAGAFTTSLVDTVDPIAVGESNGDSLTFSGKIYRAQVYRGIDGVRVADFAPGLIDTNTLKGVMDTEERWTVNQSGSPAAVIAVEVATVTNPHENQLTDSRPGNMMPEELQSVSLAPIIRHQRDEDFQIDLVQCYYENLAPV